MSLQFENRKGLIVVLVLVFVAIISFAIFGVLLLEVQFLFVAIIPFFILVLIASIIIRYSWAEVRVCPRCHGQINTYMETCRICGFQLIKKCPDCGTFINSNDLSCNNCGHKFEAPPEITENKDYIIIQNRLPQRIKPTHCPYCEAELKAINLRYCESCGTKIIY